MEEVGILVSDQDKILALTMGLPASYNAVIVNFDSTPTDQLTLDNVIAHLLNEETQQTSGKTRFASPQAEDAQDEALSTISTS